MTDSQTPQGLTTAEQLVLEAVVDSARLGEPHRRFSRATWVLPQVESLADKELIVWEFAKDGDQADFIAAATPALLAMYGVEKPEPAAPRRRLVVAPHCDDETLGCGGLLAKYPDECAVVVVSKPDGVRAKEFEQAREVLGYRQAWFLDFEDGHASLDMRGLVGALDRVCAEFKPDEMYLPYPGMHQDHIASYEAGMRAARLSMSEGHHFTPSVYVYDVPVYEVELYPSDLKWNIYESLGEKHIDLKVEALRAYASQAVTGPHPINSVKQQAGVLGHARQVEWAEQYALIRKVRK